MYHSRSKKHWLLLSTRNVLFQTNILYKKVPSFMSQDYKRACARFEESVSSYNISFSY